MGLIFGRVYIRKDICVSNRAYIGGGLYSGFYGIFVDISNPIHASWDKVILNSNLHISYLEYLLQISRTIYNVNIHYPRIFCDLNNDLQSIIYKRSPVQCFLSQLFGTILTACR